MKALILAGGKGTRLRPLTVFMPKPIVPVVNRPFLLYQIEVLRRAGISDITLSVSYQSDKIESVLNEFDELGVDVRFITEPNPMGTGGAYRFAADGHRETTIVFNGDILTDIDLKKMVSLHRDRKSEATLALVPVHDPSRYGLVETGQDDNILRFLEKPQPEEQTALSTNTIDAGIYILEPSILDLIPKGENRSFKYNVFPTILDKNIPFFAYVMEKEYWRDIGTPESYLAAHRDVLDGLVKGFEIDRSANADVATAAHVDKSSVLGEGCVIKPNARVVNSVLGPGVHIEEKATVENTVVWSHTRISGFAEIKDSVIGRSCHIGRNTSVGSGTVLGDKASLPDYSKV